MTDTPELGKTDYSDAETSRMIAPVIVSTRAATGVTEDRSAPVIAEYAQSIGFFARPRSSSPMEKACSPPSQSCWCRSSLP